MQFTWMLRTRRRRLIGTWSPTGLCGQVASYLADDAANARVFQAVVNFQSAYATQIKQPYNEHERSLPAAQERVVLAEE